MLTDQELLILINQILHEHNNDPEHVIIINIIKTNLQITPIDLVFFFFFTIVLPSTYGESSPLRLHVVLAEKCHFFFTI